ncbi:hypothetical protein LY76DRAFT_429334 [Colletotrichum caudatum]|nr:hypothetical protein LY76DRAFT_429334 [Colletotrichum caudatum]
MTNGISAATCAQVLSAPALLLFALNAPSVCYRNRATRALAALLTAGAAGNVVARVRVAHPSLAFMTGLLESWTVVWAAVLLLRHNPVADARRRRWSEEPRRDGEYEEGGVVWQRYPRRSWMARLAWTSSLLISFRGVGWQFGNPEENEKAPGAATRDRPKIANEKFGIALPVLKLSRDVLVFRTVLVIAAQLDRRLVGPGWQLQALHTTTWIATSVPFINFCHSAWTVVGALGQLANPSPAFDLQQYNPSPWGPVGAIIEYGLTGLWGVTWHNYFKFGFQSASDLAIPRTNSPGLKPLLRLLRMFWTFLLSGMMHYCGSHMLPGPTRPSNELLFFALQGVAVILQILVYDRFVDKRYRRVLNPLLVSVWLCWTEPLIFGDQRSGGMWTIS